MINEKVCNTPYQQLNQNTTNIKILEEEKSSKIELETEKTERTTSDNLINERIDKIVIYPVWVEIPYDATNGISVSKYKFGGTDKSTFFYGNVTAAVKFYGTNGYCTKYIKTSVSAANVQTIGKELDETPSWEISLNGITYYFDFYLIDENSTTNDNLIIKYTKIVSTPGSECIQLQEGVVEFVLVENYSGL